MSVEVAQLRIDVDSRQVKGSTDDLRKMESQSKATEGALGRLLAAAGIGALAQQFFATNQEFQRLRASLQTVEGSQSSANRAFRQMLDFAKETPYELSEVTQAYINLRVRGLNATKEAMTAYGNMASSFGKPLLDLVQGIAQATMGEFEILKTFGVMSQAMGDKIAFTYKGQTEIVKKSSSEINAYFIRLANNNFAGGMARQVATLGGAMSNLKDQIASTFFAIGEGGVNAKLSRGILDLTASLASATPAIVSFFNGAVTGGVAAGEAVYKFRFVVLALLALGFVPTLNAWAAATATYAAAQYSAVSATTMAAVRTVALTFAVSGYRVSALAAAAASATWSASLAVIGSFAGMLAIGLAALYAATYSYRKETAALNEELDKQEEKFNKTFKPVLDIKDQISVTKEQIKQLKAALADPGSKGKKIELISAADIQAQRDMAKAGGDVEWLRKNQMAYAAAKTELSEYQAKMDKHNESTKRSAEESKKHADALREQVKKFQEMRAEIGLDSDASELMKMKRNGATKAMLDNAEAIQMEVWRYNESIKVQELARQEADDVRAANLETAKSHRDKSIAIAEELQPMRKYLDALHEIDVLNASGALGKEGVSLAQAQQNAWERLTEAGQKYASLREQLKSDAERVQEASMTPEEKTIRELSRLDQMLDMGRVSLAAYRKEYARLRLEAGGDLQFIGDVMRTSFQEAENAFVKFATTGKASFRDLIGSILMQLAKLEASKGFAALLSMGMTWLGNYFSGGGASTNGMSGVDFMDSFSGGGARAEGGPVAAGVPYMVGERGMELFVPRSSGKIVPNGAFGGGQTVNIQQINNFYTDKTPSHSRSGGNEDTKDLSDSLDKAMDDWAVRQMKPNGLLERLGR